MAHLNSHYLKLKAGYLFPEINRRVKAFTEANPDAERRLIRCGIGDVTEPLPAAARSAMHKAVDELGARGSFRGYGPEQGYDFLRHAIAENDYRSRGIEVTDGEIFVSDGSKCDCANILDVFGDGNRIAVMDPVYPVYVDTNVMVGHTGPADEAGIYSGLLYLPCTPENGFMPEVPGESVDLIYLCSPNNPTGAVATRERLESWVSFALAHEARRSLLTRTSPKARAMTPRRASRCWSSISVRAGASLLRARDASARLRRSRDRAAATVECVAARAAIR